MATVQAMRDTARHFAAAANQNRQFRKSRCHDALKTSYQSRLGYEILCSG
jgi:hypothetical protein